MRILTVLIVCFYIPLYAQINTLEPEPESYGAKDWLLDGTAFTAGLYQGERENEIVLSNGLIRRAFLLGDNAACIAFDNLVTQSSIIRGVKPEAEITINGKAYSVGGLIGQPNYAYLNPDWIDSLRNDETAFQFIDFELKKPTPSFQWKRVRHHDVDAAWPPKGVHLKMNYKLPKANPSPKDSKAKQTTQVFEGTDIIVSVHYELYDGIPVIAKWLSVQNNTDKPVIINHFTSEIIAAIEYMSPVENRGIEIPTPNIHVETDYAFAGMTTQNSSRHTVHWEIDPDYHTQVNYLKTTPCLLKVKPELGPNYQLHAKEVFQSFRTYVLPFDSYDRKRNGLAQRRMYKTIAPWTTENPLMMHARFADWDRVKTAIDQCAEVGFEMVVLTFGSGFNIEDESPDYLAQMKKYADYAKSKGVEIGGYSLLASRKVGNGNDVVMPEGKTPTFGNSPCLASDWGADYFRKLYQFYEKTGFTLLEHDGSYPGDICISEEHPGHRGYEDSRWQQYTVISNFYHWCRAQGIYLNVPDYYYLAGSNKCAMGYREVNWSLPRNQQIIHTRQNIFDGTWTKNASMGWMFVPLTEYHGGGAAATIEPLNEHLDHYELMMASNLSAGVQACYRGPRLFDTDETKAIVQEQVDWFKKHRSVLEGDIIHLRRPDGRDLDYWLNVDPQGEEKGLLMVFNPLDKPVKKKLKVPLYYTGLTDKVIVEMKDHHAEEHQLDRKYNLEIDVIVPARQYTWFIFK
jgi:hypothetical protein